MANLPFWEEEECLRGPLPAPSNPPPPRTLFDNDDLFCYENDLENLPDTLPPLPASPLLNIPPPQLSPPGSPSITLSLPQTPPPSSPSEHDPSDSPRFFLPQSCGTSEPPQPGPASPAHECTMLPTAPITPPPSPPPSAPFGPLPLPQLSPQRPWRSFLDDNCPLRKRVKVTIIPPNRKRERSATTMNPVTHQPSPAPKRRRSCGGGTPSATTPLKKHNLTTSSNSSPSHTNPPRRVQATLCATRGSRLSLNVPVRRRRPRGPARAALRGGRPAVLSDALAARLARVRSEQQQQQQSGKPRAQSKCAAGALPLVDAAVTAVRSAARAYSETLARVAALPVAKGAVALGLALPGATGCAAASGCAGAATATAAPLAHVQAQIAQQAKRNRRARRKRVLLSFDDEEVAPIGEDEGPRPAGEALARYLSSPSTARLQTSYANAVSCGW